MTGTPQNFTAFRFPGNISSFNATYPAGTFYGKFYANNSLNSFNATSSFIFTIAKASLNGSITGSNVTYPSSINIVPSQSGNSVGTDVNFTFWRNNTLVSSAIGSNPLADTSQLSAGTYVYKLNSTGGANWTSNSSIANFTVNVAKAVLNLSISGNNTTYPNSVNVIPSKNNNGDSDVTYTFYRNGTGLLSSSAGTAPSADTTQLAAGFYVYTLNT